MHRREFIKNTGIAAGFAGVCPGLLLSTNANDQKSAYSKRFEGDLHERTWMALGARRDIWGAKYYKHAQKDLIKVANTIAEFEKVNIIVRPSDVSAAQMSLSSKVRILEHELDDMWIRDFGPNYVTKGHRKAARDFNYNAWGHKQVYDRDRLATVFICKTTPCLRLTSEITTEGSALEVDGKGTMILNKYAIIDRRRNPRMTQEVIEKRLLDNLGLDKVIWLEDDWNKGSRSMQTDFFARFGEGDTAILHVDQRSSLAEITEKNRETLSSATNAAGTQLNVVEIEGPARIRKKFRSRNFATSYLGYYLCNGAVIAQEFGDPEKDAKAKAKLSELFPNREVIQLNIDCIAGRGGNIHGVTLEEPKVDKKPI
ncbi:MAG: agmatine deiminase family protein [Lentisphaeria bacterium]|nr:agmatine deiminase family protein [Lentisphaeria bacterium]